MSFVFIASIVANLDRGPFQGEQNWQRMKEGMQEYMARGDANCKLLRMLAKKMLREQGRDESTIEQDAVAEDLFMQLGSAPWTHQKGPKVATTRRGTWHTHVDWLLPQLHKKLMGMLAVGLFQGWLNDKEQTRFPQAVQPMKVEEMSDAIKAKESVKESMRKVQRVRDGMPNQLRLATLAMMDDSFHYHIQLVHFSSAEVVF